MRSGVVSDCQSEDARLRAVLARVSWRLLPFMFVLYVIAYLDRINISFAALEMNRDLGISDEVFGLGAGIFFIGYFLFGMPSNLMVEKVGARRWISSIMVLWGIISVSMIWVGDHLSFYVLRFLLGVAEAGFFPGMILYLTYWFPARRRALAVGRFMSAIPAAGVLGSFIAFGALSMNHWGLAGWKWLFILTGAPAVILGFAVLAVLDDRPADAAWLSSKEKQILADELSQDAAGAKTELEWIPVLKSPRVWVLSLLYFSLTLGMYGFQLWLPQIIMGLGKFNVATTTLLSAVPAVFQAAGMMLVARSSDRLQERSFHLAGAAWLAAAGLILAGVCGDPFWAVVLMSVAAFGLWGVVGPFWALSTGFLPRGLAAAGIGLINSVGNLGGFAGPAVVGVIKAHSTHFVYCLSALALSLVLAGILALAARAPEGTV